MTTLRCDLCPAKVSFEGAAPDGWKPIDLQVGGEIFPSLDICPVCMAPAAREKSAQRLGRMILENTDN